METLCASTTLPPQIGVRFGVTRNSVLGVFKRVDDAVKAAEK